MTDMRQPNHIRAMQLCVEQCCVLLLQLHCCSACGAICGLVAVNLCLPGYHDDCFCMSAGPMALLAAAMDSGIDIADAARSVLAALIASPFLPAAQMAEGARLFGQVQGLQLCSPLLCPYRQNFWNCQVHDSTIPANAASPMTTTVDHSSLPLLILL